MNKKSKIKNPQEKMGLGCSEKSKNLEARHCALLVVWIIDEEV